MWWNTELSSALLLLASAAAATPGPSPTLDLNHYPFVSLTSSSRFAPLQSSVEAPTVGPALPESLPSDDEGREQGGVWSKTGSWLKGLVFQSTSRGRQDVLANGGPNDVENASNGLQYPFVDINQYEDDIVLRVNWTSRREEAAFIKATETLVLDVWQVRRDGDDDETDYGDVRMPRHRVKDFLRLLPRSMRMDSRWSEVVQDVQLAVLSTLPLPVPSIGRQGFFDDFKTLSQIYRWLEANPRIAIQSLGYSFEDRKLLVASVGTGPKNVVVTAGMVAREWASVSAALFALDRLSQTPSQNPLLEKYTFHFIPVANPDGFEYSWTEDRLWRKNRQSTAVGMCSGLDLTKSVDWTASAASTNPCSELYAGTGPLQAVESRLIARFMNETMTSLSFDISSYAQQIAISSDLQLSVSQDVLARRIQSVTQRDYEIVQGERWNFGNGPLVEIRLPDVDRRGFLMSKKRIPMLGQQVHDMISTILSAI